MHVGVWTPLSLLAINDGIYCFWSNKQVGTLQKPCFFLCFSTLRSPSGSSPTKHFTIFFRSMPENQGYQPYQPTKFLRINYRNRYANRCNKMQQVCSRICRLASGLLNSGPNRPVSVASTPKPGPLSLISSRKSLYQRKSQSIWRSKHDKTI